MLTGYNVLNQQNIFDVVNSFYGGFDQMYAFLQQNPQLGNIDFDFNTNPNTEVLYESTAIPTTPAEISTSIEEVAPVTSTIKAISQQNIFDIVAMSYGSYDYTYKLIQDNTLKSLHDSIYGMNFTYENKLVYDDIIAGFISSNNISIGTGEFLQGRTHNESFNYSFN